jgi:hypothetical protein
MKINISVLQDCCTNNMAFALSSRTIDAALLCPDAAVELVARDNRYEILGPCLANSDVAVINGGGNAHKIGVVQGHAYQEDIARSLFGNDCETVAFLPAALGYAYQRNLVDGVITNVQEGIAFPGITVPINSSQDIVTFVLVVRADFKSKSALEAAFSEAASNLNRREALQRAIEKYSGYSTNGEEAALWAATGIRFIAMS